MDVFFIEEDDLLNKYNTIWDKVSADIENKFYDKPVHNKKFLETQLKSYGDEPACTQYSGNIC